MKQGAWSALKIQMCAVEQWQKDQNQPNCYSCNKKFVFLLRMRHHCRRCGKIFCSSCCSNYINGPYIDPSYEKYLRVCDDCNRKIQQYIKDMDKKYFFKEDNKLYNQEENGSSIPSDSDGQPEQQQNLVPLFQEEFEQGADQLVNEIKKKIEAAAIYLCQKNNIQECWIPILSKIACNAAEDTKIDTLYNNNPMEITEYVKIKTVLSSDVPGARYIRGYVTAKNVSSKHMKTSFVRPRIILITKSIEITSFASQQIRFEQIVEKQKPILKKLMEKLLKFSPDVVFVEQSVNIKALQYLQDKKVTVISKLKDKVVGQIKKATKIKKKVEKLWKIEKCKPEQIIGTCQKLYFKKYETDTESETIMIIEDQSSGMTSVILNGTDKAKLKVIKKNVLRKILMVSRHFYLERYLIDAERKKLNKNKLPGMGYFEGFMDLRKKLAYTKVNFVNNKFCNFKDVHKHNLESYWKNLNYKPTWKLKQQSQLCSQPEYKQLKFYSKDDIALGGYIILKIANMDKKCEKCNRPKYNHNSIYYYGNSMIRIIVQNKLSTNRKQSLQIQQLEVESISTSANQTVDNIMTKQKLYVHLKQKAKNTEFQKQVIISYMQCEECGQKLSEQLELKRNYLEYSFLYFLLKIFISTENPSNYGEVMSPDKKKPKCAHIRKYRVFKYEDTYVKFYPEVASSFAIDKITLFEEHSIDHVHRLEQNFAQGLCQREFGSLKKACQSLTDYLAILCSNYNLEHSHRKSMVGPKNMNLIMEASLKLKQVYDCLDKKITEELKKSISPTFDWSIIVRQAHRAYFLIDYGVKIILEIENMLRITKWQQNEQKLQEAQSLVESTHSNLSHFYELKRNQISHMGLKEHLDKYKQLRWAADDYKLLQYTPIYRQDPISFISYALNSKTFQAALLSDCAQKQIKVRIQLKDTFVFGSQLKETLQQVRQLLKVERVRKDYKDDVFQVTIFNHHQFQVIRNKQGIDFEKFVKAIVGCSSWDSTGGKSGSKFAKSYNDLIVMKIINDKQFIEFRKFVSSYIMYVNEAKNTIFDSLLTKIYGIFEVNIKGKVYNCIAMQNIFFELNIKDQIVYDLKGSETNRFAIPQSGKLFTGLDTNFKIDRNGQPIPLKSELYTRVMQAMENDCKFLSEQLVIDYSLLLIINFDTHSVRMAIIDFMRPYHIIQKLQQIYKEIKTAGSTPTVIPPKDYSIRFMAAMKKYFMKIEQ